MASYAIVSSVLGGRSFCDGDCEGEGGGRQSESGGGWSGDCDGKGDGDCEGGGNSEVNVREHPRMARFSKGGVAQPNAGELQMKQLQQQMLRMQQLRQQQAAARQQAAP